MNLKKIRLKITLPTQNSKYKGILIIIALTFIFQNRV